MKGEDTISSGIYKITNLKNGKVYIGESFDINIRWEQHKNDLLSGKHINTHLQKDFNQYGEKYFKFEILQEYTTDKPLVKQAHLIMLEDAWIKLYKSQNICLYNAENTLDEVVSGNKLLQLAPNMATNILIGQLIGYKTVFNHSLCVFEFKGRNSIKENIISFYENKGKKICKRDIGYLAKDIERNIKRNKLENILFEIDSYSNKKFGLIEIKTPTDKCEKYVYQYLERHNAT